MLDNNIILIQEVLSVNSYHILLYELMLKGENISMRKEKHIHISLIINYNNTKYSTISTHYIKLKICFKGGKF